MSTGTGTDIWELTARGDASSSVSPILFGIRFRSITALWLRHLFSFIRFWKYGLAFLVVEPVAMLIGLAVGIGRLVDSIPGYDISYAEFVAPGIVLGSAMFAPLIECSMGAFNRMENQLYETQLTAPLSIPEILIADVLWATTRGLMSAFSITIIAISFGWINEWTVIFMFIPVIMTGLLFGAVGFIFSSTAPHIAFVSLVFTVVGTPLFMFSGIFFPFEVLPPWAETVSNFIPLSPAVNLGRAFATNTFDVSLIWDALFILAMTVAVLPISLFLLRRKLIT